MMNSKLMLAGLLLVVAVVSGCPSGKYSLNDECYDKIGFGQSCLKSGTHHNSYCVDNFCSMESGTYKCGCQADEYWSATDLKCVTDCTGICDYVFADANTALEHRWFTNRNGLDIIGGPAWTMTDYETLTIVPGAYVSSTASKFDAENTNFPVMNYLKLSGFTISLWAKDLEPLAIGESRSFMQFRQNNGTYITYGYQMGTDGYEMFYSIGATISVAALNGFNPVIWNHFYIAYAPVTWTSQMYLNEALLNTHYNVRDLDTANVQTEVSVGFDAMKGTKLTGTIYDLRIHNRPISIGEIKALGPE